MNLITDSKRILTGIYDLLTEDSYCLVVRIPYAEFIQKYNMTRQHLNLCIHYLIEAGYINGDYCFNNSEDVTKEVTILPKTIILQESNSF